MNALRSVPRLTILLAGLGLLVGACGGADFVYFESITSGPNPGATLIVVWMSDSPADDAEALEVSVARVELVRGSERVPLATTTSTFDLLQLQNGNRIQLARANVDPGDYDRIRVTLVESGPLVPRVRRAGVWQPLGFVAPAAHVVDVPYAIRGAADQTVEVQIDFNARTSLLDDDGELVLDPQLDALDPAVAGTIAGTLRTALGAPVADAIVILRRGGFEIRSTRTRADGSYTLTPLTPGTYELDATQAPGAVPTQTGIAVLSNETTTVDLLVP